MRMEPPGIRANAGQSRGRRQARLRRATTGKSAAMPSFIQDFAPGRMRLLLVVP